jgi:hypothetical protein
MCLTKVVNTYDKPSGLIVDGWKEFNFSGRGSLGLLKFQNFGGTVKQDVWLQANEVMPTEEITASDGKKYKAGFHIYADEGKPRGCRRVYLRHITSAGDQSGNDCVVAQEMYVPSDPDAWPPLAQMQPPPPKRLMDRIRKVRGQS